MLIAQLLACLRNVKMSVEYKQHNFVISRMNQKEAKNHKPWSGKLQPKITSLTDIQKFLLNTTKKFFFSRNTSFIYLPRETLKDQCYVFIAVRAASFCCENWANSSSSLNTNLQEKNIWVETQVCLVSTSVCRLSLCSRTVSCHCVPWSNMFAIKLKWLEWQSLWAHYPLGTMQCDSEMADEI